MRERRSPAGRTLVLSCEHASNAVPARYRHLFRGARAVLDSHRGWDPGALEFARLLGRRLGAPVHAGRVTRLLVDLNRSPGHRSLHSPYALALSAEELAELRARHYLPYRSAVEESVRRGTAGGGRVLHVSLHSFTPVLDGVRRSVDVGLLYDPARRAERELAARMRRALLARDPTLRVRRNHPYRGTADGLIPWLRRRHSPARYAGMELELSQAFPLGPRAPWRALQAALLDSFLEAATPILRGA